MSAPSYIDSLLGGPPSEHYVKRGLSMVLAGAFGGYMVTSLPDDFLLLFENPIMQFIICLLIFNLNRSNTVPVSWVFYDAALALAVIQTIIFWVGWYYQDDERNKYRWMEDLNSRNINVMVITLLIVGLGLIQW